MNDTNLGPGFVYLTPEEKEIERLNLKIKKLQLSHDALVEALEYCANRVARFSPVGEMSPDVREARAAIKAAKGET